MDTRDVKKLTDVVRGWVTASEHLVLQNACQLNYLTLSAEERAFQAGEVSGITSMANILLDTVDAIFQEELT